MKSVLSVQSHVTHGYVGGRAATFPLQCLGWDVDNINTVNFSNHTGYGFVQGSSISAHDMTSLFKGLVDIHCIYDAVVLGYIPTAELIDILATNVARMKTNHPDLVVVCDPVMGDQGHLYVDKTCVEAYRRYLAAVPVDIITPNQFELELLTGITIESELLLREAVAYAQAHYRVTHVVVSSVAGSVPVGSKADPDTIRCMLASQDGSIEVFQVPVIRSYFTGVGDLFTALLLAKFWNNRSDVLRAVNQVLTIMTQVLELTHRLGVEAYCRHKKLEKWNLDVAGRMNDADTMRFFELRVVQARDMYGYDGAGSLESVVV